MLLSPDYTPDNFGFSGVISVNDLQNVGSVSLRSSDPKDAPIIRMNFLQYEADVQKSVAAIKLTRQLFHNSAFDEFRGAEIAPGADVISDEAVVDYIRSTGSTVWHPVGTCKMGTDSMAVVDTELRVHGIEGLRVFNALAENGTVKMPLQQTFWTERWGMLVDKFGIPWMINCGQTT